MDVEAGDATFQIHSNLHTLFNVLMTMPVSAASAEPSYPHSTMKEQWLSGFASLHIRRSQGMALTKR